jgi:hypothetical protein
LLQEEATGVKEIKSDYYGNYIKKKGSNILRIGFQNIGGIQLKPNKLKDDIIRRGITKYEFDIFGMAEINVDWRLLPEEDRLQFRTKGWWESLHLSTSNNTTSHPITPHQYGGTAVWSIDKTVHRVISQGKDTSMLGRWSWTRYRGRDNQTLRVIAAYRPNPAKKGLFTVYAQQKSFFNQHSDNRCPRLAFLQDLCSEIEEFKKEGDHIILLLDGNEDIWTGQVYKHLTGCQLRELILERHGTNAPSTYRRNNYKTPIDGTWATPGIKISAGGYFDIDEDFFLPQTTVLYGST